MSLRIALLGTGQVGQALLARLEARADDALSLVHVANTRWTEGAFEDASVVIDATASDEVAARHAEWLGRGLHVVTANKLGQGDGLARWQAIQAASHASGARYGDSATVGAGLPLLRSLRALREGGDAIHGIAGVLSGSLAWLLGAFDGTQPFSTLVRRARAAGFTEPDPRIDLSGEDVRRKLLILVRATGIALDADEVALAGIVTPRLRDAASPHALDAALPSLDAQVHARYAEAQSRNARLHLVARWDAQGARVGLEALAHDDPLAGGQGTDNRVALHSARYALRPLVIQGPGAGADITAAALLDDVLALRGRAVQRSESIRSGASAKKLSIGCGRLIA